MQETQEKMALFDKDDLTVKAILAFWSIMGLRLLRPYTYLCLR